MSKSNYQNEACLEFHSRQGAHAVRISVISAAINLIEIEYSPDGSRLTERICMTAEGALLVAGAIERLVPAEAELVEVVQTSRLEPQEIKVYDSRDNNYVIINRLNGLSPWIHLLTSGGHSVGGGVSLPLDLAPDVAQAIRTLCAIKNRISSAALGPK